MVENQRRWEKRTKYISLCLYTYLSPPPSITRSLRYIQWVSIKTTTEKEIYENIFIYDRVPNKKKNSKRTIKKTKNISKKQNKNKIKMKIKYVDHTHSKWSFNDLVWIGLCFEFVHENERKFGNELENRTLINEPMENSMHPIPVCWNEQIVNRIKKKLCCHYSILNTELRFYLATHSVAISCCYFSLSVAPFGSKTDNETVFFLAFPFAFSG